MRRPWNRVIGMAEIVDQVFPVWQGPSSTWNVVSVMWYFLAEMAVDPVDEVCLRLSVDFTDVEVSAEHEHIRTDGPDVKMMNIRTPSTSRILAAT